MHLFNAFNAPQAMKLGIAAVAATAVWAVPAQAADQTVYQCTMGELTRIVEVLREPGGNPVCEVWYAKPQESATRQRLWSAANDADYCDAQAEAFVEKLRGWGWSCQMQQADASAPADQALEGTVEDAAEDAAEDAGYEAEAPDTAPAQPEAPIAE